MDLEAQLREALEKSVVERDYLRAQLLEKTSLANTLVRALWEIAITANICRDAEGARVLIGEAIRFLESDPGIRLPARQEAL
ncbi:MAG: hypothetical protein FWD77_08360 [Betaproteobacteria bacterium]|nr:hypothetical protein [Betaproteobacteria bacterium]